MTDPVPQSTTDPLGPPPDASKLTIPLWVALAGMGLAILIAVIIMASILTPLANLILPTAANIPLPDDSDELSHIEAPRTSDGEWLYGNTMHACEVASFYAVQGEDSTCQFRPFACNPDEATGTWTPLESPTTVATCFGGQDGIVNSYTWEVLIGGGYSGDYPTKFRVYLYKERN